MKNLLIAALFICIIIYYFASIRINTVPSPEQIEVQKEMIKMSNKIDSLEKIINSYNINEGY